MLPSPMISSCATYIFFFFLGNYKKKRFKNEKEIKEIKKLTEKCGNKEIATFLHHERKLNAQYYDKCIIWLPFNKFSDIKYLAKSYFGEVHRATCINHYDGSEKKYREVV